VVLEAATLAALGAAAGFLVYLAILAGVASVVRAQTGVVIQTLNWSPVLLLAPASVIALGAAAGLIPAIKAYRTDVAENLTPHS
jgi:putative ABC transport system permease protein